MHEKTLENVLLKFKNGSTLRVIKNNGATRGHCAKLYPLVSKIFTVLTRNLILYASSAFKRRNSIMKVITNPDEEFALKILEKLKENNNYCPCRLEKSADTKCICKEFREKIKRGEAGECHCGLYLITEEE